MKEDLKMLAEQAMYWAGALVLLFSISIVTFTFFRAAWFLSGFLLGL